MRNNLRPRHRYESTPKKMIDLLFFKQVCCVMTLLFHLSYHPRHLFNDFDNDHSFLRRPLSLPPTQRAHSHHSMLSSAYPDCSVGTQPQKCFSSTVTLRLDLLLFLYSISTQTICSAPVTSHPPSPSFVQPLSTVQKRVSHSCVKSLVICSSPIV